MVSDEQKGDCLECQRELLRKMKLQRVWSGNREGEAAGLRAVKESTDILLYGRSRTEISGAERAGFL